MPTVDTIDIDTNWDKLLEELRSVKRDGIEEFISFLEREQF